VSVSRYGNHELLDALINERASRGIRTSLVLTIFRYISLEDEPKLALAALELAQLTSQERDSELYQVLGTEATTSVRSNIISACATWVRNAASYDSAEGRSMSAGVLSLVLDSLARADVEGCLAHFLLGFTPFKIASSDLSSQLPHTALLRLICETCLDGDWVSDWNVLVSRRVQIDEAESVGENGALQVTLEMQLELFRRRQICMEVLYHLTRHQQTAAPTMALLCTASEYMRDGEGLLNTIARSLPEVHTGKAVISHIRETIRWLREGGGLNDPQLVKVWSGGRFDLSQGDVEVFWDKSLSDAGLDVLRNEVESLRNQRWRCIDEERMLEDALEPHLQLFHQAGWFLRTCAAVLRNASSDPAGLVSRDHAKSLLRIMFGVAHTAPGMSGASGATSMMSVWSSGRFQRLLDEATDVPEVESLDPDVTHEALEPADLDECGKPVDRWSDDILMLNERQLAERLRKNMLVKGGHRESRDDRTSVLEAAQNFVSNKIMSAYDGYNTLRKCRSARQHLLCGLQVRESMCVCICVCLCVCACVCVCTAPRL
jgi:hypothetical protein